MSEITEDQESITPEEAERIMSEGEPVILEPPSEKKATMSVYHIRLEDSTLDGLGKLALMLDETPSSIARRILREGVAEEVARLLHQGTRDQVLVQLDKLREAITSQPQVISLTTWEPMQRGPFEAVFEANENYEVLKEVK